MLWVHPIIQIIATILGCFALFLAVNRIRAAHFGKRVIFNWRRHVTLGRLTLFLWLAGLMGGMIVARLKWQVNFVTGLHYQIAFLMLPLIILGGVTGIYMDRNKARRKALPIIHGCTNTALLALATFQIFTGWHVIRNFILD